MHHLSPDEARQALADIDHITRQTRRALAAGSLSTGLMTGGIMWMLGYSLTFLFPAKADWIWLAVAILGFGYMAVDGYGRYRQGMVRSAASNQLHAQVFAFWGAVLGYVLILCLMFPRLHWADRQLLIVAMLMLAYVLMGIWLRTPLLVIVGVLVTLVAWAGRVLLTPYHFLLWMAIFGGGGLFLPGLYVKLRWK
ncbi:MAG: hypothetical protein LWX11_09365 [Firmicutes bacterium]|nr:hypothetical protein [Bacillota bacterium]